MQLIKLDADMQKSLLIIMSGCQNCFSLSGRHLGIISKHKFWQFMNKKFIKWQMFAIKSSLCRDYVWVAAFIFWQRENFILCSWNIVDCYKLCFAFLKSQYYLLWLSKVTGKDFSFYKWRQIPMLSKKALYLPLCFWTQMMFAQWILSCLIIVFKLKKTHQSLDL
jgi:hypothetical protein